MWLIGENKNWGSNIFHFSDCFMQEVDQQIMVLSKVFVIFSGQRKKIYVKDVRLDVRIWIRISFVAVVGEQNISTEIVVLVFLGKYQLTFVKLHVKVINSNSKTATNNLYLDEGHSVFVKMFSSTCLFHCFQ